MSWPRIVRVGLTEEEKIEHALALNLMRRHLSREQRRELVLKLRQQGWSTTRIAEILGVGETTIRRDLSGSPDGEPENTPEAIGKDGKTYPARQRTEAERQALVARLRQRGLSFPRIAELLGVDVATAYHDLSGVGKSTPENQPVAAGADGKTYPARQRTEVERQALAERAQALRSEGATFPEIAERAGVARPVQFGFRGTERLVASRSRRGRLRCRCVAGGRGLDLQLAAHFSARGLIETSSYGKALSGRTTTRQPQSGGPRP